MNLSLVVCYKGQQTFRIFEKCEKKERKKIEKKQRRKMRTHCEGGQ
jgi:hypothetical protein